MINFDSNHLLTGIIKQILSSFPLPKYRVYTQQDQNYFDINNKESDTIIKTVEVQPDLVYPKHLLYAPYIKDNILQIYSKNDNGSYTWKPMQNANTNYFYGQEYKNGTRKLKIKNLIYDTYTHEYLGDYLRFKRDYLGIDLMPLYNCFNNKVCNNLNYSFNVGTSSDEIKKDFNSDDTAYRIYMIPVRLFKEYTIAIDCSLPVEMCCGIYGMYQSTVESDNTLPAVTYFRASYSRFKQPFLYTKLTELADFFTESSLPEIAQKENNLKLFLKVPSSCESSIVVLEGNYLNYNDSIYGVHKCSTNQKDSTSTEFKTTGINRLQNKTITNYEGYLSLKSSQVINFKPITSLQLLRLNTGTSYPFSDRLVEYLISNVITPEDENLDNMKRIFKVLNLNTNFENSKGELLNKNLIPEKPIWFPALRPILYDYINNNIKVNKNDTNHDILGYVDSDVEATYLAYTEPKNKDSTIKDSKRAFTTLSKVDIYTKNNKHNEED